MIQKIIIIIVLFTLPIWADGKVESSELSLEKFIDHVAKEMKKTITYDDSVKGKRVYLANLKTDGDLLKILHTVLEFNGYFVEIVGEGSNEVLKVKRLIQGPWTSTPMIFSKEELDKIAKEDKLITMIIDLKYIMVREMQTTLRALRFVNPQGGNIAGIEDSNTLLVTDFAPNVNRIYAVIERMDRKRQVEVAEEKFAVENKSIDIALKQEKQYFISVKTSDNVFATVKNEKNIVSNSSGTKTTSHIDSAVESFISFELAVFREGISEIEIKVEEKNNTAAIWNFSISQTLAKDRKINFTLHFMK